MNNLLIKRLANGMNKTQAENCLHHRLWLSPWPARCGHCLCSLWGLLEFLLYDLRVCNGWISIIFSIVFKPPENSSSVEEIGEWNMIRYALPKVKMRYVYLFSIIGGNLR